LEAVGKVIPVASSVVHASFPVLIRTAKPPYL
jgi:hypothetical protein